eukprot:TRINITY_DN26914_c0_g1_i1.p1 TRINITY_DN26914_c0_g1~~TRINITY_DN26914_c0_g1_i1.p1  ORF type:complete len:340 (-),score=42.64 TRINITY_DN26914_c0_g1_i1:101-1120(-)
MAICGKIVVHVSLLCAFTHATRMQESEFDEGTNRKTEDADPQCKIANTAKGDMEYFMEGKAPYILMFHSTPGGCDFNIFRLLPKDPFQEAGFGTITVSRPGYLGTPLETGQLMEQAADAYAALLDVLGIDKVVLLSYSGGGPHAIQFAAQHPQRCLAMIMTASNTKRLLNPKWENQLVRWAATSPTISKLGEWAARRFPATMLRPTLEEVATWGKEEMQTQKDRISKSKDDMAFLVKFSVIALSDMKRRRTGYLNDMSLYTAENFTLPTNQVKCATLIVHGDADADVTFDHAEHALKTIPDATLHVVEPGSHIPWVAEPEKVIAMHAEMIDFAKRHAGL